MLGIPVSLPQNQDHVFGKLVSITPERIEIELDVPYDLRGWGGAPVLLDSNRRVIGMLQAHYPQGSTTRVIVSPLAPMLAALERPLDGGKGQALRAVRLAGCPAKREAGARRARSRRARRRRRCPPTRCRTRATQVNVQLDIEYPPEGAVVGSSACGVFVAGRALAMRGDAPEIRRGDRDRHLGFHRRTEPKPTSTATEPSEGSTAAPSGPCSAPA